MSNPTGQTPPKADIALLLEGTYPFIRGGVSSWVHQIITGLRGQGTRGCDWRTCYQIINGQGSSLALARSCSL